MDKAQVKQSDIAQAIRLHQRGELAEAIRSYRRALRNAPQDAAGHHLLGLAYFQNAETEKAAESVEKAVALKPELPAAKYNLGRILQALGRHDEAIQAYLGALQLQPDDFEAHNNIGIILKTLNRYDEAISHYERALVLRPNYPPAYLNLANALQAAGRYQNALMYYEKVLALQPDLTDGYLGLGNALRGLGRNEQAIAQYERVLALKPSMAEAHMEMAIALKTLNRLDDAITHHEKAVALQPDRAQAHLSFGDTLQAANKFEEAIQSYESALAIEPDLFAAQNNIGFALCVLGRYEEALHRFNQALAVKPDYAEAKMNLAIALSVLERQQEAIEHFNHAIALKTDFAEAKINLSAFHLSHGRFAEGWEVYDQLIENLRRYPEPRWNGQQVKGALLVWGEQGLGDQILHAGMVPEIMAQAGSVILEVEPRLVPLFERSFPGVRVISLAATPYDGEIDAHEPLSGLGRFLRTRWEQFPKWREGYLTADHARAMDLRRRLTGGASIVVGLSWLSYSPQRAVPKSARLRDFESLLRLPGCRFVDLQYGDTCAERDMVEREFGIRVERLEEIDNTKDIDGLAALITACDVVITVSNTTAHLAGALGKPTWVMVPHGFARIWYWFREREDSPWYPNLHLKRQARGQSWANLISSVTADVSRFFPPAAMTRPGALGMSGKLSNDLRPEIATTSPADDGCR